MQAKLKEDYKRNATILMSGIEFRKNTWTTIPKNKEASARKYHADMLDFRDSSEDKGIDVAQVPDNTTGTENPINSESEMETARTTSRKRKKNDEAGED